LVAQRWILAALKHLYSLAELNAAIAELLIKLNDWVMRHVKDRAARSMSASIGRH
jgi:hypothetical protein